MWSFLKKPPRIPELVFAAVLLWLFAAGQGWSVLLADGDTGWHIRNGERILDTHSVPHADPFAFGSAGHPWYAWEWLSDVVFALLYRGAGLRAVTLFCGIVIAASIAVLFRHMIWRSVGVSFAFVFSIIAAGASSIHYLARPHVIGLLLFAAVAWMVDRERRAPARTAWMMPFVFILWTNCHGSFLAGLAMLGIWLVESLLRSWRTAGRPAILLAACSVATLVNPYGWHLHCHAIGYLRSGWIQAVVDEFQSPRFRSENMLQYELLLLAGVSAVPWLLRRKDFYPACVILFWAHESLSSARHVPLYCLAAGPFLGSFFQKNWDRAVRSAGPTSLSRTLYTVDSGWRAWTGGYTLFPCLVAAGLTTGALLHWGPPVGFPAIKFPVGLVERNSARLSASPIPRRVFSSDQWSDYLIFRLYPGVRVYFDGRSDFFGLWRGKAYQELLSGDSQSPEILDREGVEFALVPKDWALAGLLKRCAGWRVEDSDDQAILFTRKVAKTPTGSNQTEASRR